MDALDVAFAGVITTGAVGVVSPVVNYFIAQSQRLHERQVANDARLYESRSAAYDDLLTDAHRTALALDRSYLAIVEGEKQPSIEPSSDEEWMRLLGRAQTFGSESVLEAARSFEAACMPMWRDLTAYQKAKRAQRQKTEENDRQEALRRRLDDAREEVARTLSELGDAVRAEIAHL